MIFSKSIGRGDSNLAVVLAIREAFLLFSASRWRSTHIMVVESDSKNAVQWINEPKKAPWRMRKWIFHIEMLKRKMVQWEVQHVSREANQQADNLAKSGIGRVQDLLNVLGEATNIND